MDAGQWVCQQCSNKWGNILYQIYQYGLQPSNSFCKVDKHITVNIYIIFNNNAVVE